MIDGVPNEGKFRSHQVADIRIGTRNPRTSRRGGVVRSYRRRISSIRRAIEARAGGRSHPRAIGGCAPGGLPTANGGQDCCGTGGWTDFTETPSKLPCNGTAAAATRGPSPFCAMWPS